MKVRRLLAWTLLKKNCSLFPNWSNCGSICNSKPLHPRCVSSNVSIQKSDREPNTHRICAQIDKAAELESIPNDIRSGIDISLTGNV